MSGSRLINSCIHVATYFSAMPSPYIFGLLVDSSCVTDLAPCGRHGACLLYDMETFRVRVHSFALGLKIVACLLYSCAYLINMCQARRRVEQQSINHDLLPGDVRPEKTQEETYVNNNEVLRSSHCILDESVVEKLLEEDQERMEIIL